MKKKESAEAKLAKFELIQNRPNAQYDLSEKLLGISFLEASQRDFAGVLTPEFAKTAQTLSVPESTLRSWWKNRDHIRKLCDMSLEEIPKAAIVELSYGILQILRTLRERGYDNMSSRDLNSLLNTYVTKMRLLAGRSTANVANQVSFSPVPPAKNIEKK